MQTLQEYLNQNYERNERNKFGKEICGFSELYTNTRAIYYSFFVGDKEYKVFAFVSTPIMTKPKNGYPAVLILHGGNGMAYAEVTKMWADKGFVAIAHDLNGKCGKNLGERFRRNEGDIFL